MVFPNLQRPTGSGTIRNIAPHDLAFDPPSSRRTARWRMTRPLFALRSVNRTAPIAPEVVEMPVGRLSCRSASTDLYANARREVLDTDLLWLGEEEEREACGRAVKVFDAGAKRLGWIGRARVKQLFERHKE